MSTASTEIVRRYSPALAAEARCRILRYKLRSLSEDDLVQEAWTGAFRHRLGRFEHRGRGSLLCWLKTIVAHRALDHARRAASPRHGASAVHLSLGREDDRESLMPASNHPSPTSDARYREYLALCQRALTAREWEAWRLVEIEQRTAREAASLLATTDSAVRSLVHRARERIIQALRELDPPDSEP